MHEFSLATEVIKLAQNEAGKRNALEIQEITIEIGDLSGVDIGAFESALQLLRKDSILSNARLILLKTPGKGKCIACEYDFEMNHRLETCPKCNSFPSEISGGEEFRVVSMVVE